MKFNRYALSAMSGLALSSLMVTASIADTVRLKMAGTYPATHFGHEIVENMVKEIEDAGVGIKISYFPASQLGSGEELVEDAIRGNVDLVQAFIYAQTDPRLEMMNLPGLVTTFDELKSVYANPESNMNKILAEIMDDLGLVYLGNTGEGLIGIVANKKPNDPNGFGDKGMNIRVWSSEVAKKTTESLGYRTTTMNWAEVLPALQAGVIDGAICCTPEWAYSTFATAGVGKYFIPVNTAIEASSFYASGKSWEKLNQEQRDVIRDAAEKAALAAIDKSWDRNEGFIDKLKEAGWEILEYNTEERAALVAHIQNNVWPDLADMIGQDIMDVLTEK
ncbi:C4-dicarboxylate-binding periplasmic protein DctP [Rhodobacteraceae bacterium IMCC1933]|nr:C4-dicarboxylate-binding periplasmic protein DctP [Rhodobacteraceae bacterium IMCC1923]MDP4067064.1 C4-dicarboxylate-binding periplasmic protein DctP [Rhodobacteraceae bacterium IMCC1933]MDP4071869.1 C4-dicarboxylate-binding periplasmic protein DctP [Rhodobacteraceae bacterium IMCC1909]